MTALLTRGVSTAGGYMRSVSYTTASVYGSLSRSSWLSSLRHRVRNTLTASRGAGLAHPHSQCQAAADPSTMQCLQLTASV